MNYLTVYLNSSTYYAPVVTYDSGYKSNGKAPFGLTNIMLFSDQARCALYLKSHLSEPLGISIGEVSIDIVESWLTLGDADINTIRNLISFQQLIFHAFNEYDAEIPESLSATLNNQEISQFLQDAWQTPHLFYVDKLLGIQQNEGIESRDAKGWHELLEKLKSNTYRETAFKDLWEKILNDMKAPELKNYFKLLLEHFHQVKIINPN